MLNKVNSLIPRILNVPRGVHTWEFGDLPRSDTDLVYHTLVSSRNTQSSTPIT